MNEQHAKCPDLHRHTSVRWWSGLVRAAKPARDALAEWWNRDRIRIAPTSGRLLSLREGDRILLRDRLFCVQQISSFPQTDLLVCQLTCEDEPAILKLELGKNGQMRDSWLEVGGKMEAVFDDDVVVLAKAI